MLKDLMYAARTLRKSPVFALTVAVTLALGIGASTAIFSVTNAVLLRPLPYRNPDRLVFVCTDMRKRNVRDFPFSNADFLDLRHGAAAAFQELGAVNTGRVTFPLEDGSPEEVRTAAATPNIFRMLGARIVAGRDFTDADGEPQPPEQRAPAIAILSYDYWQRRYGGSTAVLGRGMLNSGSGGPQIVGVVAPRFELLFPLNMNSSVCLTSGSRRDSPTITRSAITSR